MAALLRMKQAAVGGVFEAIGRLQICHFGSHKAASLKGGGGVGGGQAEEEGKS